MPADQVSLEACQHFCLWIGYHLAPRAVPRKRGQCSQSPAESPICRPSPFRRRGAKRFVKGIGISGDTGMREKKFIYIKITIAPSQLSRLQLEVLQWLTNKEKLFVIIFSSLL